MKQDKIKIFNLFLRYIILIIIAIFGFKYIYFLFTPLTTYPVAYLLGLFYHVSVMGNSILIGSNTIIEIIGACVAGAAYFFLLMLNLAIPNVKWQKRGLMIVFSFAIFLIINILRIFFLGIMYDSGSLFFEITHKIFWYLGSTLFVVLIWFLEVKIFKIKTIPFYTDLKSLYKKSIFSKNRK